MIKVYLLILVVVVALLAIPTTRRAVMGARGLFTRRTGADTVQRAADAARTAGGAARGAGEAARTAGDAVTSSRVGHQLDKLAQTLVIAAPVEQVAPVLTRAMEATSVLDPVATLPGESLAWAHSGLTDTRLAAIAHEGGTTVFGVVAFEYAMRMPQGASAADQAVDRAREMLAEQGISVQVVNRSFDPGPTITADGPRVAQPFS